MKVYLAFIVLGSSLLAALGSSSEEIDSSEFGTVKGPRGTNCTCGWANKNEKRIVSGVETGINEFPFMAGLMSQRYKIVICGGSIITEWHVLTAAHCTRPMVDANTPMAVVVGEHDTVRKLETDATKIINVKYPIEHEKYGTLGHPNDIALLVLEEKIEFTKLVGPVCLPTNIINLNHKYITVMGWGRLKFEGGGSSVLMKVNLKVVPTEECNKKNPLKIPTDIPRQFCTGGNRRKDSCKGDSGGPLVMVDPETNRYVLHGIVSMGFGCATEKPGINTNVAYYLDWIQRKVHESVPGVYTCSKS
uniref:Venom S1 protease 9 n=1 Tax=Lethocerus distinctifemur TaxID=280095 RepID=A0A2K8JR24_9HEMI|nr:venom S1 protease 9 [Lethocerus distinctifemur]